ncbi:MAG: metallophosphoesterase family protein [bacterium]|nr:metallophosphoesterase family protein [bacterium]
MRRFVIGDVHGCVKTLRHMIEERINWTPDDRLILLGDYVNKGPDSKAVLDYIAKLKSVATGTDNLITLRGNHDDIIIRKYINPMWSRGKDKPGIAATLRSFNVGRVADIPRAYIEQLDELKLLHQEHDFICVHASFNTSDNSPFTNYESMLWDRTEDVDLTVTAGRRVICGHTPQTESEIRKRLEHGKIILDGGCVYVHRPHMGNLVAMNLDTYDLVVQKNIET